MRRLRSQSGFTLVEVLLAMSLMLVIMSATLAVFATMERKSRDNQRLNDAQMQARVATDTLAKRLRNLASPADSAFTSSQPIERAQPQDLIFRTVNSTGTPTAANPQNVERYRYCLAGDGNLYAQRQADASQALPAAIACPGTGWPETRVAAQYVTNSARPVFHYELANDDGTFSDATSVAAADFPRAIALRTELFLDPQPTAPPRETTLTTRVFLRNQNRPPTASFVVTFGSKIVFNASASDDPEGKPLTYRWLEGAAEIAAAGPSAVFTYKPATTGLHQITLEVSDVGGLKSTATHTLSCSTLTSCSLVS